MALKEKKEENFGEDDLRLCNDWRKKNREPTLQKPRRKPLFCVLQLSAHSQVKK